MPPSLIQELKELSLKNHFMDLSEEIRFIIKQKMIENIDPFSFQLQKLKDEIRGEVSKKSQMDRIKFVEELNKLLDEIKRG
jgi:hypothetical protein